MRLTTWTKPHRTTRKNDPVSECSSWNDLMKQLPKWLTVQSPGYDRVADRYEVTLTGGTSKLVVDTTMPPEDTTVPAREQTDGAPGSLADLPPSLYPNLVALAGQITNPSMDERFRFGLKVLLDGLERRIPAGS